jgi:hypothetical protein
MAIASSQLANVMTDGLRQRAASASQIISGYIAKNVPLRMFPSQQKLPIARQQKLALAVDTGSVTDLATKAIRCTAVAILDGTALRVPSAQISTILIVVIAYHVIATTQRLLP